MPRAARNEGGFADLELPPVRRLLGHIDVAPAFEIIDDLVALVSDEFTLLSGVKVDDADGQFFGRADEADPHRPGLADDLIDIVARADERGSRLAAGPDR